MDKRVDGIDRTENKNTRIYLVRHGESEGNLKRICLGHTNLDLTERGREQALFTAEALRDVPFATIYSSDLIRAMNTARPHADMRSVDVIGCDALRELYFGDWENQPVTRLEEVYGELYTVGWRQNFGTFIAPGGESVVECAERIESALEKIAAKHPSECILVVSHAACIRALWGKISGVAPAEYAALVPFPSNASYSLIEYDGSRLYPISYSIDEHLADLRTSLPMK